MISNLEKKNSRKISKRIRTIFRDTSTEIIDLANKAPTNIVESVHLIRKWLKFLRAFVKLTQFCSYEQDFKTVNYILRDCGRTISDCRDTHVRGFLLAEYTQNGSVKNLVEELNEINNSVTEKFETSLLSGITVFDELISEISNNQIIDYFESLESDAKCLADGLGLGYEKSYHAFHSESKSQAAELLHEWRKRTKDLQYQREVLLDLIHGQLPPSYEEVTTLCEILGRINDLFMFLEWLDSVGESVESKNQITELKNELNKELKNLVDQADTMGNSLFALSPEEFGEELNKQLEL